MGLKDKLMFWKKGDDFSDLGFDQGGFDQGGQPMDPIPGEQTDMNQDIGIGPTGGFDQNDLGFTPPDQDDGFGTATSTFQQQNQFGRQQPQRMQQQSPNYVTPVQSNSGSSSDIIMQKNLEVISSKLDALRASLESINQRLSHIEHLASSSDQNSKNYRNW